jgi:hypothetical protein
MSRSVQGISKMKELITQDTSFNLLTILEAEKECKKY